MSGFTPNLVVEAEMIRLRRMAEWQAAVALGGQLSMAEQNQQGALPQAAMQAGTQPISEAKQHYNAMMTLGQARYQNQLKADLGAIPAQDKAQAFVDAFCGPEVVPVVQPAPTIQQALAQVLGALAVLSERSRCVMGQSLMGTFVDPVAEPVVVAASKPVNRALARAMGCGSRQAIGFMVR